jgi:hypothetical protein
VACAMVGFSAPARAIVCRFLVELESKERFFGGALLGLSLARTVALALAVLCRRAAARVDC